MTDATQIVPLPVDPAILLPDVQWGPAMQALPNDRQRLFVCCLFEVKPGHGQFVAALKMAGYGVPGKTTPQTYSANASRLAHNEKVQDAIREEQRRRLTALAPGALRATQALIGNPKHRDHGRAIAMILDRVAPIETHHRITSERRHVVVDPDRVLARIAEIAARVGLDLRKLPAPIDADYQEVATEEGDDDGRA